MMLSRCLQSHYFSSGKIRADYVIVKKNSINSVNLPYKLPTFPTATGEKTLREILLKLSATRTPLTCNVRVNVCTEFGGGDACRHTLITASSATRRWSIFYHNKFDI